MRVGVIGERHHHHTVFPVDPPPTIGIGMLIPLGAQHVHHDGVRILAGAEAPLQTRNERRHVVAMFESHRVRGLRRPLRRHGLGALGIPTAAAPSNQQRPRHEHRHNPHINPAATRPHRANRQAIPAHGVYRRAGSSLLPLGRFAHDVPYTRENTNKCTTLKRRCSES